MPPPANDQISMQLPFRWIFLTVLGLTLISFVVMIYLSSCDPLTEPQKQVFASCDFVWKAGFGAIIGLFGGKVTK